MGRIARLARLALMVGGLTLCAALLLAAAAWWSPLPVRPGATDSTVVRWRDGRPMHVFLATDDRWRIAVDPEDVDPAYISALKMLEDKRFDHHPGVDPIAVVRAALQNVAAGRVVSGASTLTMQLARLIDPRPRTLRSKAIEAFRALQLELHLSKEEILAEYMRFTPFGGNLEGVGAASLAYFGHGPEALAPEEIAVLLAVPQAPARRRPHPGNTARLGRARDAIAAKLWPGQVAEQVERASVPRRLRPLPREVPHLAARLHRLRPEAHDIVTTLDRGEQRITERILEQARSELTRQGIHNGVAVVADPETAQIVAIMGNLTWDDPLHGAQIQGFDVARSAGSLLKPFLFATALDNGLALPDHTVADTPLPIGGWTPRNYDGAYEGLIRLDDALLRSRNVPFVRLLQAVEVEPFLGVLRQLGAHRFDRRPGWYGLSAAIGGVEITPLEVAGMYVALANAGQAQPLRLVLDDPVPARSQVLSPGSTWLTRRALARGSIHWKSGTSYGHRDAWAAGSGGGRTVVVWLGNFDNRSSSALIGAKAAGPLLTDLLGALAPRATDDPQPRDLVTVDVCTLSGHLAAGACPKTRIALAPERSVAAKVCPFHVHVDVAIDSGLAVGPSCRASLGYAGWETRSFVRLPSTVRTTLERAGSPFLATAPSPPDWAPGCGPGEVATPPKILSPVRGAQVRLIPGLHASDQEVPLLAESGVGGRLSWFVDGEFLGSRAPGEQLWWTPSPGQHQLTVVDAAGGSAARRLAVQTVSSMRASPARAPL